MSMSRIQHQILLLEEGDKAWSIIQAIEDMGADAFMNKLAADAKRMSALSTSDRSIVQHQFGDETIHRDGLCLCINRKYGYASLTRKVWTRSAPVGRGTRLRASRREPATLH